MNKILIRCDGKDVFMYIKKTISEVAIFISDAIEEGDNFIGIIDGVTKERIFINPKKVTLIEEVTDDEPIIGSGEIGRVIADKLKNAKINQVLGN